MGGRVEVVHAIWAPSISQNKFRCARGCGSGDNCRHRGDINPGSPLTPGSLTGPTSRQCRSDDGGDLAKLYKAGGSDGHMVI